MATEAPRAGQAVWIARHGNRRDFADPTWSAAAARPHDPELSADGVEQARELGRRLLGTGIGHIFASPFLRAVETASHVAEALDLGIKVEHGACEWLHPEWFPGASCWLCTEDLARQFPRVDLSYRSRVEPAFPETDEGRDCWPRAAYTARLLAAESAEDVLIVCHASPMMGMVYGLVDDSPELSCGLCSFAKVVWNGRKWELALNEEGRSPPGYPQ